MAILMPKEVQKLVEEGRLKENFLVLAIAHGCLDTPQESAKNSLIVEGDRAWQVVDNDTNKVQAKGELPKA